MTPKIVAAIVTCLLNLAIGVAVLAILVISLNGYSARPGQAALITYIVLAVAVTIVMSLSAFFLTGYLTKREFSGVVAGLIAVPVFSVVGAVLKVVSVFIGILVAEVVRVNFCAMIDNYSEFWDFYVQEHSQPLTRILHFVGTSLGLALLAWFIWRGTWYYFPLCFIVGYAFAWVSHFVIEKNKPATFKYPLWSFVSDYKMMWYMITGRMSGEVERALRHRAH